MNDVLTIVAILFSFIPILAIIATTIIRIFEIWAEREERKNNRCTCNSCHCNQTEEG